MKIGRVIALLTGGGLWVIAACGGSTSNGGGTGPVASSDFANQYAHAVCDNIAACCAKAGIGYDANACLSAAQGIIQGLIVNPATAAGATYDPNAAGACIDQVKQAALACGETPSQKSALNNACNKVYSGSKKPGEPCNTSLDCQASSDGTVTCDHWSSSGGDGGTSSGTLCQVRKTPVGGEPCGGSTGGGAPPSVVGDCGYGASDTFMCDYQTNTCQPRKAVGQSCTGSDTCVTTAYCAAGKCAPRLDVGAACQPYDGSCNAQTRCDSASKTCQPKLADGAACTQSSDCAGGRCSSNKCASSSYADPTVCGGAATH